MYLEYRLVQHKNLQVANRSHSGTFINQSVIRRTQHQLGGRQTDLSDVTTAMKSVTFDETVRMRHIVIRTIRINNPQLQVRVEQLLMKMEKLEYMLE